MRKSKNWDELDPLNLNYTKDDLSNLLSYINEECTITLFNIYIVSFEKKTIIIEFNNNKNRYRLMLSNNLKIIDLYNLTLKKYVIYG